MEAEKIDANNKQKMRNAGPRKTGPSVGRQAHTFKCRILLNSSFIMGNGLLSTYDINN
jgi:hypothetical protein